MKTSLNNPLIMSIVITGKGLLMMTTFLHFSFHHQSINELGMNIRLTATSTDGNVGEGIEHKNVYGVEFHLKYSFYAKGHNQ